jgi:hypothetical protein
MLHCATGKSLPTFQRSIKVMVKFTLEQVMMAKRESRGIAQLFL